MEKINKPNRYSRFLAAYIDVFVLINIIAITEHITSLLREASSELASDLTKAVPLFLYSTISILYIVKDNIFKSGSLGKYLLGLRIETTSNEASGTSVFKRNLLGALVIVIYSLANMAGKPVIGKIVFLAFLVFNILLILWKPAQKIGDYIAHTRVTEDQENKLWRNTGERGKNTYVATIGLFLLFLLLWNIRGCSLFIADRIASVVDLIYIVILIAILTAMPILIFYKLVNKFIGNRLLKILLMFHIVIVTLPILPNAYFFLGFFVFGYLR
ncbi:MAG: RDD family protein [Paludibacteraceae bacterium]|nr:RDD family protein [Paludibacteraceae bacterium]